MLFDGLTQLELSARLRSPELLFLERTTSTLDVIHELARDGAPNRTVVLAEEQTHGRGRMGRRWTSPPGKGVWLGYLHRPENRFETGVLALRVGLIVRDVLETFGVPARSKWPNDVLAGDRKISGILCEARWNGNQVDGIAVGIGVNVHGPIDVEFADSAAAVDDYDGRVSRVAVLEGLVAGLQQISNAPKLTDAEVRRFESKHWLAGRLITEPIGGTVEGINDDGALLVQTPDRLEVVSGGHIVVA